MSFGIFNDFLHTLYVSTGNLPIEFHRLASGICPIKHRLATSLLLPWLAGKFRIMLSIIWVAIITVSNINCIFQQLISVSTEPGRKVFLHPDTTCNHYSIRKFDYLIYFKQSFRFSILAMTPACPLLLLISSSG